ncbi:hypothetical protein GEMRC1_013928 [Eukaryota sp. GEM-RC1]
MESDPSLVAKELAGLFTTDEPFQQRLGTAFDLVADGQSVYVASQCLQNCTFSKGVISSLRSDVDALKEDVRVLKDDVKDLKDQVSSLQTSLATNTRLSYEILKRLDDRLL